MWCVSVNMWIFEVKTSLSMRKNTIVKAMGRMTMVPSLFFSI